MREEKGKGGGTTGRAGRACGDHLIFSLQVRKLRHRKKEIAAKGTWYLDSQAGNFGERIGD